MLRRRSRSAPAVLVVLAGLFLAAPGPATAQQRQAQAATEALEHVEELAAGQGVDTGRELTPALLELVQARPDMTASQRARASRILARPTDPNDAGPNGLGPYTAPSTSSCSAHFCVHWVEQSADAAAGSDNNLSTVPGYVETVKSTFEQSYAVENGSLGWRGPLADAGRGGDNRVDVYLQDIGGANLYGYAAPDPQPAGRSLYSYLVLDNDYDEFGYPDPLDPLQVTAAHEYNHVLQYAYDSRQDDWMFEATATWAEEKVFGGVDDYVNYLDTWADLPFEPMTSSATDKMYGSAIFNHWLDRRYGAQVVRRAWADSQANSVSARGFAPGTYDKAIRASCGIGFAYELSDFFSSSAEWDSPASGIHEGASFPKNVLRGSLAVEGTAADTTIKHTAFRLYSLTSIPAGPEVFLTGGIPGGTTPGSIALVGHRPDDTLTKALGLLDANGLVTVSLTNPSQYDRITAVITNASVAHGGVFNVATRDWNWTGEPASFTLRATTTEPDEARAAPLPTFTPCTPAEPEPEPTPEPTPSPTVSPSPTLSPTVTPTPTVTPPPVTSVRLSRNTTRLSTVLRTGKLSLFARTNKAGRLSAKATVDTATAKRLQVGRRTTTAGTGRRTATAPSRLKVTVKLTRKLRAAIKRHRKRALKLKLAVTLVPVDGTAADRDTITLTLKP